MLHLRVRTSRMMVLVTALFTALACARGSAAPTTQPTRDGRHELVLPDGWKVRDYPRHKGGYQLFAESEDQRGHVAVEVQSKVDVIDASAEQLVQSFTRRLEQRAGQSLQGDLLHTTVNGFPAVRSEIHCVLDGRRWRYRCTAIEMRHTVLLVACTAQPSRFEEHVDAFELITNSARESGAPTTIDTAMVAATKPSTRAAGTPHRSRDGRYEITLPPGWTQEKDGTDGYLINVASPDGRAFVSVRVEDVQDLADPSLDRFAEEFKKWFESTFSEVSPGDSERLTVNGRDAIRYDVRCVQANTRWVYMCTAVETEGSLAMVIAYTNPSRFESTRATLEGIVASFRECPEAERGADKR